MRETVPWMQIPGSDIGSPRHYKSKPSSADMGRIRTAFAATTVAIAVAGGVYGVWAILNAIMSAAPLTQFIVGAAGAGAGVMGAYMSAKGD